MYKRLFFTATQRNRDCIGDVLSRIIKKGSVLEIGSGSGEHGVVIQKRFPGIIWQTSDPELVHRKSISSWIEYEDLSRKMPQPLEIDVEKIPWKIPLTLANSLQGIVSIKMIHVANCSCTVALFRESGKLLNKGNFLILYGPFKICNKHISESNYFFDISLKVQNDLWGIKNLEEVCVEGKKNGFTQEDIIRMPANNLSIIYRKVS